MSAAILRMSDAETLKFLECYRNENVLWDPTNEGYKEREIRAAAAQRIAEAMNIEDFTASHVITKFKNLRSSYAQELKKIAASTQSGGIYVPKVIWFKQMDAFLRPHVKSRVTQSNLNYSPQEAVAVNDNAEWDDAEDMPSHDQFRDIVSDHSEQPEPSAEQSEPSILRRPRHITSANSIDKPRSSTSRNPHTSSKRLQFNEHVQRKKRCLESGTLGIIMATMNKLEKISEIAAAKDDNFDHFGRYIASLLRILPNDRALMLQQDITTLVLNTHMSVFNTAEPVLDNILMDDVVFSPSSKSEGTGSASDLL